MKLAHCLFCAKFTEKDQMHFLHTHAPAVQILHIVQGRAVGGWW